MALQHNVRFRAFFYQWLAISVIAVIAWFMFTTASDNLAKQDIATGFSYLSRQAGFVISEAAISFSPNATIARALLVGLANTVKVSVLAAFFGAVLGLLVGIGRMSRNPLLQRLMLAYVEALRNVPLLLYLLFWYAVIINVLPPVRSALPLAPHFYLSNSGLVIPSVTFERGLVLGTTAIAFGIAGALAVRHFALRQRLASGQPNHGVWYAWITAVVGGISMSFDLPEKGRFRMSGGLHVKPEFVALFFGLSLSASANIAEIVRAGIQAVNTGQWEASMALGLSRRRAMRLVILPQALRLIIPPLTNTYLTVFKNSSLAIAIGYPDLVMVSNTVMNQTGQAMETIAIFMAAYLSLSLAISLFMNWYNSHVTLKER